MENNSFGSDFWDDLAGARKVDQVEKFAIALLKSVSINKGMSGKDIFKQFQNTSPSSLHILERTFRQYLSNLSGSSESEIEKVQGKKLYQIREKDSDLNAETEVHQTEPETAETQETKRKYVQREKAMYEMLVNWAETHGYQSSDISQNTKNGKWGNPDVLGVSLKKTISGHHIDLLSIEAKPDNSQWRQFFFEAVSHRRFCDRVYFCYAAEKSTKPLDADFRYYSELFKVGILVMQFEKDALKAFHETGTIENPEEVDITEALPAPKNHPPEELKYQFLSNLGLNDVPEICRFGSDSSK